MLTAQEVHQVLHDVSVGSRSMRRLTEHTWNEIYCGLMTVEADGWMITFFIDCGELTTAIAAAALTTESTTSPQISTHLIQ